MRTKVDPIKANQLSIFDLIKEIHERQKAACNSNLTDGSLDFDTTIRELISHALKNTQLNRYGVAAEMSRLLGKEVTKSQLDSWSAESKENNRFYLSHLNALMAATGDKSILRFICEKAGGYFIESSDAMRLELGKIQEQEKELQKRRKAINEFLLKNK